MNTEQELINEFLSAQQAYEKSQKAMEAYYRDKIAEPLKNARTKEDFEAIKWLVATMPECTSKVLIFRTILILAGEI
jgi:hypothetical protein